MLAAAGAVIIVADLNEERGKRVADDIGGVFARTDVTDEVRASAVDTAVATGVPLRLRDQLRRHRLGRTHRRARRQPA